MFVYYALLVSGSIGGKVIILVWVRVDVVYDILLLYIISFGHVFFCIYL